ncbi:tetratricopeptide repeat protein [Nostoc sp.]|uniref:tetratricopeptide repeat protein n=1 Tax=Nostoc sp. TaxID=1180 RepID=UPI0035931E43
MKLKKLAMSLTICANAALLITVCAACQPVDKVAIYEKNNGKQPVQAELLAKIAVGYAKLGQQDKASKLLAPAIQTIKINESIKTSESIYITGKLLEQLGITYVEMGLYDKGLQLAKSLKVDDSRDKDYILKRITTPMLEVGQYEKALQIAKLIPNGHVFSSQENSITSPYIASQSIVMSEVALKYAQAGQKAQAQQILVQALQKAKTSDEMAEIALKYAQVGQKAKALQVLAQVLQNAGKYPYYIAKVAVKYAQVGQQAKGEQLLAQAFQSVKKKKDAGTKYLDLADIAIGYAKLGQFNQAIETTKLIKDYLRSYKDPFDSINAKTSEVFAEIAKMCAAAGRYEQAFQVIREIKRSDTQREALGVVAVEYAKKSQYEQAFQVLKEDVLKEKAETILFNPNGDLVLAKIVEQATKAEPSAKAEQVLSQALEVAKTMKLHFRDHKVEVITAIAIGYTKIQQKDKSKQLLAQALKIAENTDY